MNFQKKKLIIFTHGGGRFTNQLISYGHLIGFLVENNYKFDLINLAFWDYAHLLETTAENTLCTFPTKHNQWQFLKVIKKQLQTLSRKKRNNLIKILYFLGYLTPNIQTIIVRDTTGLRRCLGEKRNNLDLENTQDINLFNKSRVTIMAGWGIRSWTLFKKYQLEIKNSLAIRQEYYQIAEKFTNTLREKYSFLIGVLIRQGDYRTYANGKYFFATEQYIDWIKQATALFGTSSKLGFVIASDEPQDIDKFKSLDVHFATGIAGSTGHYLESMAELSLCDVVMTPPSTFGVWAAFLGNIPILAVYENSQQINQEDLLNNHIYDAIAHPHLSVAVQ